MSRLAAALAELHDTYLVAINRAVAEDRLDIVARLEEEFTERSLHLVLEHG
ncbi:MAG: hypothetical protein ACRDWY_13715 [Actinomycetes bacterium]